MKTEYVEEGVKIGTCEHCGDEDIRIYENNERCEECDDQFVHCSVCNEEQHCDDKCRHVFEDDEYCWQGAGIRISDSLRPSFLRLLELMPDGFAKDLKTAIRSGKFHTFTSLPLIGGGGSLWLYGIESKSHGAYAARLMEIGSSDLGDDTSDGWHVLVSLYNEETKAANRIICKWITEFLKDKNKAK